MNEPKNFLEGQFSFDELVGNNHWVCLNEEATGGDLQDIAWGDRDFLDLSPRASEIDYVEFINMENRNTFKFRVDSVTTDDVDFFFNKLKVHDIDEIAAELSDESSHEEAVEVLQTAVAAGNVSLLCQCASFDYHGFNYLLNQTDAKLGPAGKASTISPSETNPDHLRFLCKHLYKLLDDIINEDEHVDGMAQDFMRKVRTGRY